MFCHIISAPCYRQCKPQCTNTYNEMTIKMTKFPSKQALTHGALIINQSRYSIEYLRKNSIELIVHFSSLTEVKVVRNLRFSFIDTIGAFGGLCGLMVGASLVTTFELVFCVTDIVYSSISAIIDLFQRKTYMAKIASLKIVN